MNDQDPAMPTLGQGEAADAVSGVLLRLLRAPVGAVLEVDPAGLSPAGWQRLAAVSERHGLGPLLHARLGGAAKVPEAVQEAWRRSFLWHTARNVLLQRELGQILGRLGKAGIPSVVLKGAYLSSTVYEQVGQRPMNDLDLLVPAGHLVEAARLVLGLGYSFQGGPLFSDSLLESPGWASRVAVHHESRLHKPPGCAVELHWNLAAPHSGIRVDVEGLWERSRPVVIAGHPTRALAPEDLILHLCLHATRGHRDALAPGIRPLWDLAAVIRREAGGLDWETLVERARLWRVSRGVGVALELARSLLGADVPGPCLRALGVEAWGEEWRAVALRRVLAAGRRDPSVAPDTLWVPELGRLTALRDPSRGWELVRRVFPGRRRWPETDAFRRGLPFSWRNQARHVGGKAMQFGRLAGHLLRHPVRSWAAFRRSREEARFGVWIRGE